MLPIIVMVAWIYVFDCLPLTIQVLCFVGCLARRNQVPVIYYINLILSNVIKICAFNMTKAKPNDRTISSIASVIYLLSVMASLYFKTCIALERYFFIACPLLDFIRKTKTSVLVCLLVWTLCVFSCPLEVLLQQSERIFIFALFPAPLFICCLAGTLRSLPDATSVPSEEKQRIIGTLVLLLVSYCLIIIPTIILIVLEPYLFDSYFISIFSLLNSFEVLILFVIMCRGPVENALECLCCCSRSSKRSSV
ncbi:carboxypeptidase N regulatory subunit [Sarotherodon galilaeus]